MKNKQTGVSLSRLMFWGVIVAMVALLVIKVAPSAIEFYKIKKGITATAQNAKPDMTVADIRNACAKYAEIDHTSDVTPADLEVTKEGSQVVISVSYEKRIPLFGPASLLIDYQASSQGK